MPAAVEFMNELIDRFAQATAANRSTPGRRGASVHLNEDSADAVLLAGDLHGNRGNFNKLVKAARLDKFPKRHLVLQEVVHGGGQYPGGGCMSHMLLEDVAKLKTQFPDRFHFLLCNHELAEVTGQQLLKAGVSQNLSFATGLNEAYGPGADMIAKRYHSFTMSCPLAVRLSNGVFISHTLPDKEAFPKFDFGVYDREITREDALRNGPAHAAVWGRDYDAKHVEAFLAKVGADVLLTGHEPIPEGSRLMNPRQIAFDCSGSECFACVIPLKRRVSAGELAEHLHRL